MLMQKEFPFTHTGALQEYNRDQMKFMYAGYQNHILLSGLKGEPELWTQYQMDYVLGGKSKQFAANHRELYFENIVERQTAESKRKWDNHDLTSKLLDCEPMYMVNK